ncbi:MAG TPA: aminotransferase class V-fold PLP-dependent enzyme [Acidimicrobiales bacterium]|nr:aminotransferase class V-fold PLP-dependent enzyme [Acidimicrobiales bacterium]
MRHYLDHASTTPLRPAAAAAVAEWLERLSRPDGAGDPSRVHEEGRAARAAVEAARAQVAELAAVAPSRVVFTSGATEAVNTAVAAATSPPDGATTILCARVEHSSVREASARATVAAGGRVVEIAVDREGVVDLDHLSDLLATLPHQGVLVHCQWGNHEIGSLQPVQDAAELCRRHGALLHVDAAAAFGHVPVDAGALGAAFVSVSSHKMGGPGGVGALLLGQGVRLRPYLVGGSEERGRRAGYENLLGIVGFGAAAGELARSLPGEAQATARLRDELVESALAVDGVSLLGPPEASRRLPHIACLLLPGVLGEAVLLDLDRHGIAAHSGSACSSEVLEPSPVLEAIGADPDRSLRLSLGWSSSTADVAAFSEAFPGVLDRFRRLAGGAEAAGPHEARSAHGSG